VETRAGKSRYLSRFARLPRKARAWLALTIALALHVGDEATTDFLGFYNPMVLQLRQTLGWFPMPTFSFWPWLIGLTILVLLLLALTPFVARGGRWVQIVGYPFATIMMLNGIAHVGFSLAEGRMIAGVWTAPLLLVAAPHLFATLRDKSA